MKQPKNLRLDQAVGIILEFLLETELLKIGKEPDTEKEAEDLKNPQENKTESEQLDLFN